MNIILALVHHGVIKKTKAYTEKNWTNIDLVMPVEKLKPICTDKFNESNKILRYMYECISCHACTRHIDSFPYNGCIIRIRVYVWMKLKRF